MNMRFFMVSLLAVPALSMYLSATTSGAGRTQEPDHVRLPKGVIVMWSGRVEGIPKGWSLCDGTKGTPDLRNRFVLGAGTTQHISVRGGSYRHSHKEGNHSHRITLPRTRINVMRIPFGYGGNYGSQPYKNYNQRYYANSQTFNSSPAAPQVQAVHNLPPFYKVAFIMKD